MSEPMVTRRRFLAGGLALAGTGVLGSTGVLSLPAAACPPSPVDARLAELEATFQGRLGVFAVDTSDGRAVGYRQDERFLLCSTGKMLDVADCLRRSQRDPDLLSRVIHYGASDLVANSPITSQHVADGMTVQALCQAAMEVSDNTAANLIGGTEGGPAGVTAFTRTLGDPVTRLDRTEPSLNQVDPTRQLDTTSPRAITADLWRVALGPGLAPDTRRLLVRWMLACTTGDALVRAGVPSGWTVADKSGSGDRNERNDIAVVWPPGRPPLVIAVYTAPDDPTSTAGPATIARATSIAISGLAGRGEPAHG